MPRPQILLCKICRRQAKLWLFPFGKSEKRSFFGGRVNAPPLLGFPEKGFFYSIACSHRVFSGQSVVSKCARMAAEKQLSFSHRAGLSS